MEVQLKTIMRPLLGVLASTKLDATPLAAAAQHHGGGGFQGGGGFHGGGHAGSFHGGSAFRGGGWNHGGGWHGGGGWNHGGYYRHGYGGYALGGFGLGLALGAASAPWGYYGPDYYDYPAYAYVPPPAPACGWVWNPARGAYDWYDC